MLDKIKQRGDKAKELLENEAFGEACARLEKEYFALFMSTKLSDVEKREQMYLSVNVLNDVKNRLQSFYSEALSEQHKVDAKERAEKLKKKSSIAI